jgi:hypothetical protein
LAGAGAPLVAAAALLVADGRPLRWIWWGCAVVAALAATLCSVVKLNNVHKEGVVRKQAGNTYFDRAVRRPFVGILDQLIPILGYRSLRKVLETDRHSLTSWVTGSANPPRRQREALLDVFEYVKMLTREDEPAPLPVALSAVKTPLDPSEASRRLGLRDRFRLRAVTWGAFYALESEQSGPSPALVGNLQPAVATSRSLRRAIYRLFEHRPSAPWAAPRYATVAVPDQDGRSENVSCAIYPLCASAERGAGGFVLAAGTVLRLRLAEPALRRLVEACHWAEA